MRELKIKLGRRHVPIFDLPAAVGRQEAVHELGDQIDALITFMDDLSGDTDLEDSEAGMIGIDDRGNLLPGAYVPDWQDEDREPDDDAQGDPAWLEWHTRGRHKLSGGGHEPTGRSRFGQPLGEDDEDDDPAEEDDDSGQCDEDGINTALGHVRLTIGRIGAGCPIADPGGEEEQLRTLPQYGEDQSAGPINAEHAARIEHLQQQLADFDAAGMTEMARRVRNRIAALDKQDVRIAANEN